MPDVPTQPPVAPVRPHVREHHGRVLVDDYEWLRDKEDPEVIAHLEAENAWTEQQTSHLAGLREEIFDDIRARTRETDLTVPTLVRHTTGEGVSAWWYYARTVEGQEYPIQCRLAAGADATPPDLSTAGPDGLPGEQVLLDGNAEAGGEKFFSLGTFAVSPDGRRLAFGTDVLGDERYTLRFVDLETGERLADEVPDTAAGAVWGGDQHLFYTRADEAWRPFQVLRHRLGTAAADDPVVLTEDDERFWVGVDSSRDDRWVLIGIGSKLTSEYHLLSCDDPEGEPRLVTPRREGVEYHVEVAGDRLLVVHNDGALDFALAEAPLTASRREDWREVLPHREGVRLLDVDAYAGHVLVSLRRDGLTGLHLMPRDAAGELLPGSDLTFDEPLYTVSNLGDPNVDAEVFRFAFTSLVTPMSIMEADVSTGERRLLKRAPVLDHPVHGPYRSEDYVQERIWATAPDGVRVPISLVHHKDVRPDGSAPALLYGYGSYEIPMDPGFSIARLSLLDRGFVHAVAHVRGGGELGRSWYEQGKELAKRNTFTDFVACAEHLVAEGWTSHDRLAAEGGSAGGLLMGAVANLAPHAFRAVHAAVPFVDNLTTILDPDLPLTVIEWEEWGDPLHDAEVYDYMASYAPYENVAEVEYPAILATTSLNDTRVYYVEPAKWVAQLRRRVRNGPDRPVLLKTEMVAGHGGVSGRYEGWRETAFELAWLIDQVSGTTQV
ncbi:S9 family peptidase [Auraticoccus monumenti]|uniref:Oligopeptidase B n=1 Tax=Auraticoccus monumenti TaxID=675864 RepID=A0A1G7CI04_9ACTN|nr:S9 family peptidase [Auraticoccus monumenti]SDE38929.1 oligopeptidase B [Auraticoccus monumenti]